MAKKMTSEDQILVMKKLSQRATAWLLDCKNYQQLSNRVDVPRNSDGSYDAQAVHAHLVADASRAKSRMPIDDEGEISDAARKLQSEANILEMKEQLMAGTLVRVADIQQNLDRLADAIRTLGENFGRSPMPISGPDVQQKMNDMIDSLEWDVTTR